MSIHSQEEWDFFKNTVVAGITGNIWIGGYQPDGGRVWKWDDDSPFDWTNWEEDNPNGAGYCIYLWETERHEWADAPCGRFSFPFVCKM